MFTLRDGVEYQMEEGVIMGGGRVYHSDYSYRTALLLGEKTQWKPRVVK